MRVRGPGRSPGGDGGESVPGVARGGGGEGGGGGAGAGGRADVGGQGLGWQWMIRGPAAVYLGPSACILDRSQIFLLQRAQLFLFPAFPCWVFILVKHEFRLLPKGRVDVKNGAHLASNRPAHTNSWL